MMGLFSWEPVLSAHPASPGTKVTGLNDISLLKQAASEISRSLAGLLELARGLQPRATRSTTTVERRSLAYARSAGGHGMPCPYQVGGTA